MLGFHEPGFLVGVADAGEVGADDFELGVEAGVVGGHFEHAQVEEGEGAEGSAGDEDEGRAVGGLDASAEAGGGEFVVGEAHVVTDVGGHDSGRGCEWWFIDGEEVMKGSVGTDKRDGPPPPGENKVLRGSTGEVRLRPWWGEESTERSEWEVVSTEGEQLGKLYVVSLGLNAISFSVSRSVGHAVEDSGPRPADSGTRPALSFAGRG